MPVIFFQCDSVVYTKPIRIGRRIKQLLVLLQAEFNRMIAALRGSPLPTMEEQDLLTPAALLDEDDCCLLVHIHIGLWIYFQYCIFMV